MEMEGATSKLGGEMWRPWSGNQTPLEELRPQKILQSTDDHTRPPINRHTILAIPCNERISLREGLRMEEVESECDQIVRGLVHLKSREE